MSNKIKTATIGIWDKLFKKVVSDKVYLQGLLQETINKQSKLKNSNYDIKGRIVYYNNELVKLEASKIELISSAKSCLASNDDILLLRCKRELELLEVKVENITQTLEVSKKIAEKIELQYALICNRVSELSCSIESLNLKSDFSSDVDNFKYAMGDVDSDGALDKIDKDINIKFNASEIKLSDIEEDIKFKTLLKGSNDNLEEFKNSLRGE